MAQSHEKYRDGLKRLSEQGDNLMLSLRRHFEPDQLREDLGDDFEGRMREVPSFFHAYQMWYSEAREVVKQLLPDRVADFVRLYERPKGRRDVDYESYVIEDCLHDLQVMQGEKVLVSGAAALPRMLQQLAIVRAAAARLDSVLFDIAAMARADVYESEIASARGLAKFEYFRAAGVVAGVVLEKHLAQVCDARGVSIKSRKPTIGDFSLALKEANVIDVAQWRQISYLADIRNKCGHHGPDDPTALEIDDIVNMTSRLMKTLY